LPPASAVRTVWMLGSSGGGVRRCECETDMPKPGPLPRRRRRQPRRTLLG
jgi:hypothetical protein